MAGEFLALVSLHPGHHNKSPKDQREWARINASAPWQDTQLPPLELADWISSGKAWTACHLGGRTHSEDSVQISNLIVLDIDGDLTLEAFWAIPAVQRHCLFTATSCSHTPEEHRFRALFACEAHEDTRLHGVIYDLWVERLGLKLKDDCGRKPERLWYGNDQAILQFGGGEPIPWDLIENARDSLVAAQAAKAQAQAISSTFSDDGLDFKRAIYCFDHLLRVSVDGDFSGTGYWKKLLVAAAATGHEEVQQAFLRWHERGHHAKTQDQVKRRVQRSRTKKSADEGLKAIFFHAGDQHGNQWRRLLPPELQRSRTAPSIPTSLMRSRSASDVSAEGTPRAPDTVPPLRELERLAEAAQPLSLMASRGPETSADVPTLQAEPLTLKQKLRRLYQLRAHGLLEINNDLQEILEHDRACLDRELLGEILAHPGYCNQPSEVERDLLTLFRAEQGLRDNSYAAVKSTRLVGPNLKRPTWLVPGFLLAGGEHILYSKPGVGKTTLALHMARAVTGDPGLDRFLDSGPLNNHHHWQRNKVIFIGTDMFASAAEMTAQYLEDFKLLGLEFLEQIEWWFETEDSPPWQLNLKDLTKLYQTLEGYHHSGSPAPAVFIDSMKAVCPDHLLVGQQGFKDYIKLVKMICKRFSAALIWVHHSRADGSGAQGITRITEGSDVNFHMKRDEKTRQITLDIEKIRGGKGRVLYVDPFKNIPVLLPNPDSIPDGDDLETSKELLILEVLAENFKQHRLLNMTSSAEWIERNYFGMKIGEIEEALQSRYRSKPAGLSRASLERMIRDMVAAKKISGKGRYRLPPHFQVELPQQGELTRDEDDPSDLPGW